MQRGRPGQGRCRASGGRFLVPELKRPADTVADDVTNQAAAWLLRLRGEPQDPDLKAEFEAWLSRDARHAEAWERARRVWSLAGAIGPAPRQSEAGGAVPSQGGKPDLPPDLPRRLPPSLPRGARRNRRPACVWGVGLAMAAGLCLAVVLSPSLLLRMQADHASPVGEMRTGELDDGTQVQLDSGSAIAVDYAADRRSVELLAGQAFFSVRQDRRRPFSVKADDVGVTVTGTEFEVRLMPGDVSLAVAEGEIRVSYPRERQGDGQIGAAELVAGQGLRIGMPGGTAERKSVRLRSIAAWRRGRLLIERATIGELIEELRRYRSGTIVITDDALAARQVTGVFDLTDPVRALETVVGPHAGRVREITPWLVVVSGR